ncbi:MAG: dihydrofolate reductase family protein [Actinomycetales bacterium]
MSEPMNKVIVWMQSSLDGRTQGPNGEFDWPTVPEELTKHFVDVLGDAGMFGYGRRVFEMMAGFWPIADELPGAGQNQIDYARIWKPMRKLVFSRSLEASDWNTTVVRSVDPAQIAEFVRQADGDLYLFGGSELVSAFFQQDLVDEVQTFVHPVVLGGGAPLYPELARRRGMSLVESQTFDGGVVGLRHARNRSD